MQQIRCVAFKLHVTLQYWMGVCDRSQGDEVFHTTGALYYFHVTCNISTSGVPAERGNFLREPRRKGGEVRSHDLRLAFAIRAVFIFCRDLSSHGG